MKWLLARIGLPNAFGLYVDEDAVTLSQVVSTPFGPVEVARHRTTATPDELPRVLKRLLGPLSGRSRFRRAPVAVGLPAGRVYFSTRPIQTTSGDPSPHVLLREALRSPNLSVNEMFVDVVKAQPDKREVASIVSCDGEYLKGLLESLEGCDVRPPRVEPMPCALLRAATRRHRARRGAKVVMRIFLSDTQALAVLVVSHLPVVWRTFSLPRGDEASAILSACRALATVSKDCGIQSPLDAVMLHGRPDLARLVEVDWVQEQVRVELKWLAGPPLDGDEAAFGLALGCLSQHETAFDLARSLKPRVSLGALFPWREAVLQAALLVCMALFLANRLASVNDRYVTVQTQNAQRSWMAGLEDAQLQREKQELTQKVVAIRKFLDSRIAWTSYGRDLAASLPPNVFLTSFKGDCELQSSGRKRGSAKPKKSLVLRGAVAVYEDGLVPHEIDRFLDTLRGHPTLKRDFPVVELAGLKQSQRMGNDTPVAYFTVICLPKAGGAPGG